jgi:Ca-activated chloride channel family protein
VGLSQGGNQSSATTAAVNCAAANTVAGRPLTINSDNVEIGGVTYSQNGRWQFTPGKSPSTAARVTVQMADSTVTGSVPLLFGRFLGVSTFSPTKSSTAAFVRNKVCLCFDRSRSMTFDLTGVDETWPTSSLGYPQGVPSSAGATRIGGRTYDFRWLYPPCNNSRWSYLQIAANAYLDELNNAPTQTPVALVTWASSTNNASSKDVNNQYHTYTGSTLNTSSSITSYSASTLESTFVASYDAIRSVVAEKGGRTMLGGTDTNSGLQQAVDLFAATEDGIPCNKIIILFSDGMWNVGVDPATHAAVNAANAKIVVHTVGFMLSATDAAYGNKTMADIAAATGGTFYRATDGASLKAAFEELARTLPVILTQ